MLPAPRIIAIDDEQEHLEGLAQGLNRYGAACLPVHFTGETETIPSCPDVRVIFADLHLGGGLPAADHAKDFSMIGGLIEDTIKPSGPYIIVLWTLYPEQAESLYGYLKDRLESVAKPFAVWPLDKKGHFNPQGEVKVPETLVGAIEEVVAQQPQVGALLNWEGRVLGAAADTMSSIMSLAESAATGVNLKEEIGRLLGSLAVAAVGKEHVEEDRFRAVNEALLPILGDRIASMRSREEDGELWQAVFDDAATQHGLSPKESAKLNSLLHIARSADDDDGTERGAVIALPEGWSGQAFGVTFDLAPEEAAEKQFWHKQSAVEGDSSCWVLVQTQAACDYAQTQPGPLPFHLGLIVPESQIRKGTSPAALWRSPCFEFPDDEPCFLHVNARFQVSLPRDNTAGKHAIFRLREQLLNDLIYHLHGYGARPGIISLRTGGLV